jgi:predicted nucleic acid-binding Zn ribbon protein
VTCPACGRAIPPDEVDYAVSGRCRVCRGMDSRAGRVLAWLLAAAIGTALWAAAWRFAAALLRAIGRAP